MRSFLLGMVVVAGMFGCKGNDIIEPDTTPVATVSVTIQRTGFRVGESLQVAALPLDASGGVLTGRAIVWSSSNQSIAAVTSGGLVTGLAPGSTTISAQVEGKTGGVDLQISLVPVATVTVTPGTGTVSAGATVTLNAILKDSADRVLTGRTITWSTSNPGTAAVSATGVVSGILVGTAEIVASVEGKQGKAVVTVNTVNTPVATVTVTPENSNMSGGATKLLTATLRDANGNILTGRTITWSSSNLARATVSAVGLVTAAAVDAPVVITATVEGKSAASSIGILTFTRLSAGTGFACGLIADGTAYCWGLNEKGQLGDGTTTTRLVPTRVSTELKFVVISSSADHSCGLTPGGVAYCWGSNLSLKLGAAGGNSSTPVPVSGGYRFVSIAPGTVNTCATTSGVEVYCWGLIQTYFDEPYGGRVTVDIRTEPIRIGSGMVAVVSGVDGRYCSVDATGLAYCWTVQFFVPQNGPTLPPAESGLVSPTLRFTTLRMGVEHVCGIVGNGQAYCWGQNDFGQLGDGTTTDRVDPTLVSGGLVFESLAAGGEFTVDPIGQTLRAGFTCGVTPAGKAYCWGSNEYGNLGIGSSVARVLTPQPVAGGASFTGIRASSLHTCGLAVGGAALCWGSNAVGQLGNGTTASSNQPTLVFGN